MSISIIHPQSEEDYQKYFLLRWEILRKPWNQPRHLSPEPDDAESIHFMAVDEKERALAVCRLHYNTPGEAQVRFVAVHADAQGKGIGKQIMKAAERYAKEAGASIMMLQARENAVDFYLAQGYEIMEKSYLLFDAIQHYKMQKEL